MKPERWDASNAVRLCDKCEGECGVGAGADKGDRACSTCGSESAPHIYPEFSAYEQLEKDRDRWERIAKYEMERAAEGRPE